MKLLIGIPVLLRSSKTLKDPQPSTFCKEQTTTSSQQAESTSFHDIRQNPGATNLSAESIRIIQQSRGPPTTKIYDNYIGKWKVFCREMGINPISPSLNQPIEFLTKIFESGVGYSSVGTVRSVLSSVLIMDNGASFGKHPLVQRFIKGIFNLRPVLSRQFAVWDTDIVLDYLSNLEYDLPLKDLSEKLVTLLCLLSGQRDQTVKALNIKDMLLENGKSTLFIKRPMKTPKPGFHQSPIVFSEYSSIVTTITHYLEITNDLRITDQLIINYQKPHKAVMTSMISRWSKVIFGKAGIDIEKYSWHSTRLASTSDAKIKGLSLSEICQAAD